ncbi:hypothetical protein P691DRAFT_790309 [Macrolepiota fuliginosa MF-IS2]|uniref:Carrier domain-containing protein n=1 Tax=Macrolepiota fuliginosa MF-IS2 TaxID=1400762 RepID=A0A9P6BXX8_9AGAR|nr:hypothetical protein P691DRAFT_790309 [Macrolepiota fuliginosa MF-IS2]
MLLEDALREPPGVVEVPKTAKRVFYGGAPMDKQAGRQLLEMGVPIVDLYGTRFSYKSTPRRTIGLQRHCGRKDSVTVLSNGEKADNGQAAFSSVKIPQLTTSLSTNLPMLFDRRLSTSIRSSLITRIKQMVIIADAHNKPFLRTDQNTIKTKATLELYKREIDAAYDSLEAEAESEAAQDVNGAEEIVEYVRGAVSKVAERPFGDNDDSFENGLDSLHSVQIRTEIKPLFATFVKGSELSHNIAYAQPTISYLSTYLISHFKNEHASLDDSAALVSRTRPYVEQ